MARCCRVVLVAGVVLGTGCSDDDASTQSLAPVTVQVSTIAATQPEESPVSPAGATSAPLPESSATTTGAPPPSDPGATSTTAAPTVDASIAEAGGWRLVISEPLAGATFGNVATLCFEVTGTSREPDVAFDVSAVPADTAIEVQPIRVDGAVGRGAVEVELDVEPGRPYDLRVQLVVDGTPIEGGVVTVERVVAADTPPITQCT